MENLKQYTKKILNEHCDWATWVGNYLFIILMWATLSFILFLIGDNIPGTFTFSINDAKWTVIPFIPLLFINDWRRANSILDNNKKGFIVILIMTIISGINSYTDLMFFNIMSAIMSIWIIFANSKRKSTKPESNIKAS